MPLSLLPHPPPPGLSQEFSSSTESIDNSFSSVSGDRLGWVAGSPHGCISSPSPDLLSPQAKAGFQRCPSSWDISPSLPGLPDLKESPALSPMPRAQAQWGPQCDSPQVLEQTAGGEVEFTPGLELRTLSPRPLPSDHQIFTQCLLSAGPADPRTKEDLT